MTPQEKFFENQKRLELAEANTNNILERYDNSEYHRMIWSHRINCSHCNSSSVVHSDSADKISPFCHECERPAIIQSYVEILEYDETYAR